MKDASQFLQNYHDAFSEYLLTGNVEQISQFIDLDYENKAFNFLKIYRNGFLKTSIEALSNNFPVTANILTNDIFKQLAREYVLQCPASKGTMTAYGETFPSFLKEHCHLPTDQAIILSQLAQLDYVWLSTLYKKKSEGLNAYKVQQYNQNGIDIEMLSLTINSDCQIVQCSQPSIEFWQKLKLDQTNDSLNSNTALSTFKQLSLSTNKNQDHLLFWQSNNQVMMRTLNDDEYFFLKSIQDNGKLGESAQATVEQYPNADIAVIFSQILSNEILTET